MNRLPLEIVHRILEYDGRIKYRHGKYMNQISPDDNRYKMLLTVPQILPYPNHIQIPSNFVLQSLSEHGYLLISDTSNKIYCVKKKAAHTASYYGEKVYLIVTISNIEKIQYIFINQGCYYNFIIYKYKTPQPSLFSYITEYLYDYLCKFI